MSINVLLILLAVLTGEQACNTTAGDTSSLVERLFPSQGDSHRHSMDQLETSADEDPPPSEDPLHKLPICLSSPSSLFERKERIHSQFNTLTKCLLGDNPDSQTGATMCETWSINIVIALKSSSTNADLKNINQFMMNINQYCDDRSMISIFAPGYRNEECKSFNESMFEHMVDDLLGGLQSFVIDDADSTYETTRDLYFQQLKCSMTDPSQLGGLTIVFTNSDCKDYCTFNDRTWHDPIDNPRWTQLYYSGDWDDCVTDAPSVFDFLDCENNQGKCNYTKLSLSDLNEEESSMRTCKNSSTLNATLERSTNRLKDEKKSWLISDLCEKSNIRWRKFFLREQLQKGNITVQDFKELSAPCGQPPSAEVMAKLTYKDSSVSSPLRNMNHYSEHFMRTMNEDPCEWEIGPGNLLILENKVLGHGAFATVCKGVISGRIPLLDVYPTLSLNCKHGDEIEVAVKRMPNHADEYARSDFYKEIEFMKTLGYHRHVISMFGAVTTSIDPILVVEYCQNGDLLRFLRGKNKHILASDDEDCPVDAEICLRVKDLVSIAWQIADGMSYLSSLNFIHRDLAARNVLLTSSLVAKISDFGLGRHVDSTLYMAKGGRLPLKWMPPEALKFNEFSQKSDVWSFGIVLYELFSLGKQPFPLVQPFEMVEHIENGGRPPQPALCPDPVFEVQSWSLSLLSSDRPTFEEAKNALSDLLNTNDEKYGYLDLAGKSSSSKLHEIMNNIAQIEENDEEEGEESADPPSQEIEWLYIGERSVPKCDRKRSASMNIDSSPSSLIPSSPLTRAASSNLFERRKEFLRQSSMERGQSIDVSSPQELIYPNIIVTTPTPRAGSVVEAATTTSECASRCECGFEAPPPYSESWPASHRCHRTMEEGLEGIGSIMP